MTDRDDRPIAGGPPDPLASPAMTTTASAIGGAATGGPSGPPSGAPSGPDPEVSEGQLSLTRRLRQPRTIVSIVVPVTIIVIFAWLNRDQLGRVPGLILQANPGLVVLAFLVFYAGFPLRGFRWARLLRGTGLRIRTRDATEILFLSWLVNCIVPAKLGDVYRAWLLKINSTASLSRTFGTVFIERIFDLFTIAILGLAAGWWSFRDGLPPAIQAVFIAGLIVVGGLGLGLFTMRNFGRRIFTALPLPARLLELYDRFEEGVFGAVGLRALPLLGSVTAAIWATESLRLFIVVQALAFPEVQLGLSGAVFVALIGSLLTAVPLSPAGLGFVEAGVVGVLTVAYGVPLPEATAIALLDRVISVFSIIVLGSIAYAMSAKPRGAGVIVPA
jgi:glycosyltransferase 2 family protein